MCLRRKRPEHNQRSALSTGFDPHQEAEVRNQSLCVLLEAPGRGQMPPRGRRATHSFPGARGATDLKNQAHPFNTPKAQLALHMQRPAQLSSATPSHSLPFPESFSHGLLLYSGTVPCGLTKSYPGSFLSLEILQNPSALVSKVAGLSKGTHSYHYKLSEYLQVIGVGREAAGSKGEVRAKCGGNRW